MEKLDISKIHDILTSEIKNYINLIKDEYGSYMPKETLDRLNNIEDYNHILKIYDYGNVNAFANINNIMMPLCADKVLNKISKIPGYGINKNHKTYDDKNIIINNNTFLTYVTHVFISGTDTKGYYQDLLLHETMHFCGGDGSTILKEGINELLTRMLAKKYNLRTNSCGYPKEVKLSYELVNLFGEDIIKKLAFMHDYQKEVEYLSYVLSEKEALLYSKIYEEAQKEFNDKYYSHMNEFNGAIGIIKKIKFYKKIDYSKIYEIIENYKKEDHSYLYI